jgi:hypothetical protein
MRLDCKLCKLPKFATLPNSLSCLEAQARIPTEVPPSGNVADSLAKCSIRGYFDGMEKDMAFYYLCQCSKFERLLDLRNRANRSPLPTVRLDQPDYRVPHSRSLASLRPSASICHLCSLILESITSISDFAEIDGAQRLLASLGLDSLQDGFYKIFLRLGNDLVNRLHIQVERGISK